jgi:hypothetical protein
VDRGTGHLITKIGGLGAFFNVSVYKYGNRNALQTVKKLFLRRE